MTEYEYEYYSVWKRRPNTNTNIIRFEKSNRIRIRILFGLKKLTEYEYYLAWKNRPNTNTNTSKIFRYRIICSPLPVMGFIMTSFMGSHIRMLFGLKNKVDRIQIQILFSGNVFYVDSKIVWGKIVTYGVLSQILYPTGLHVFLCWFFWTKSALVLIFTLFACLI